MKTLKNKVVAITGAGSGIGRALALDAAKQGASVAICDRNADALAETVALLGDAPYLASVVDVRSDVEVLAFAAAVAEKFGPAHVIVNNAGVAVMKPFLEMTAEEWHRQVDVNVNALYHVTRAVLPGMVARGHGHVCIIGSTAGRNTFVGGTCYAGTKHFVMGFAESLMLEVRDAGVGVSVITPGSVDTDLFPVGTNRSWMLEPKNVADAVGFAIEAPAHMLVHRLEVRPLSPKRPRVS